MLLSVRTCGMLFCFGVSSVVICNIIFECLFVLFFFSSIRRHTRCALVTGVQTCALPIYEAGVPGKPRWPLLPLAAVVPGRKWPTGGQRWQHTRTSGLACIAAILRALPQPCSSRKPVARCTASSMRADTATCSRCGPQARRRAERSRIPRPAARERRAWRWLATSSRWPLSLPPLRRHGRSGCHSRATGLPLRSEEHTSELQSLMRISYAVFCLHKKTHQEEYDRLQE